MSEIPKAYEPQAVEAKWYQFWLDQRCFVADPARVSARRPAYSIVIPPPNITGILHMGHVLNNTIQDILARKARMDGKEVLWVPGTDHASISTHSVLEKELRKRGVMKHRTDLGREKFLEHAWAWKEKYGGIIIQQLKKLGCSCDWTRERFTMDPDYSRCVERVFVTLYKKGLIYRGKRMVNWCPATLTALSDEEVVMKEQKGLLYYFRVEVAEDPGTFVTIATTRPETIPGDTAVAVNPRDPRYTRFIGKHGVRPLPPELPREQKLIPIIGDDDVDFKFGTGVLKVTPAHDPADFAIGQRHHLPLIDIMTPAATMNALAGKDLAGLDRFKARQAAVEKLKELGLLEKEEPYQNNVGFSERADVPIEPRLSEQWFLKYPSVDEATACLDQTERTASGGKSLAAHLPKEKLGIQPAPGAGSEVRALPAEVNASGRMRFYPDRWAKTYTHWMVNIQDWCISRQLWWGHRIPVWYSEGWTKTDQHLVLIRLSGHELPGRNIRELRAAALDYAQARGIIGQAFLNLDTGQAITVHKASLEHGFSHFGVANVKLVPGLPDLLRHAVRVSVEPHIPPSQDVLGVETYLAALQLGDQLFRVKFRVKVFSPNLRLYDHQTVILWPRNKNEPDGNKSPEAQIPKDKASRPASGSDLQLADLVADVNHDPAFTRCQLDSPGPDWTQDPDVLDTWFSSWLWPFATMGWTGDREQDAQNPTLKTFYPTTDLVTAPEIIFFWVARMIMAGYEFMGDLPFRNVYFTGIIRDKQGRKMSKSLGNSPDPLDLIAKYGADAVRFGTMRSAPLGQDVLFDEKDVELGRNFCNKLWNACRFRQMQGGAVEGEIDPRLLSSDDKWILLRLDQAIREIDAAFAEYRFNEVAQTLYRFFWSEYCDWYVEASKAVLAQGVEPSNRGTVEPGADSTVQPFHGSTNRRANTLAVIDFILSHTLRLFHPFLPFITEELWHGMGFHDDLPADQGGRTIMVAPWPKAFDAAFKEHYGLDATVEQFVNAKYELVGQGRNLRREANIPAGKKVRFVLKPAGQLAAPEVEVLKLLLQAEALEVDPSYSPRKGTPAVHSVLGELYLPLEGLVDLGAERARLTRELAKIDGEIEKVQAKLNNPAFREKVPPAVLEEHQKRLADWQAKQTRVQQALDAIGAGAN